VEMNDLLSIIVPVYKADPYIARCVESILAQTYKNFEIILIDDGSPDSSGVLCDEYAKKDSRVKSVHKTNGGLSSARNLGLDICSGQYIGFVDSDDWITPDMYEYLIGLCEKYNTDLASCSYRTTKGNENNTYCEPTENDIHYLENKDALRFYLQRAISGKTNDYSACTKVYRRTLIQDIRFPDGRIYEDMATNFRLLARSRAYVASERICYYYYINPNSITKRGYSAKDQDLLVAVSEILKLSNNIADPLLIQSAMIIEARAYFSLLGKIVLFGSADSSIPYQQTAQFFCRNLRSRLGLIFRSGMPFVKKAMAVFLSVDFRLAIAIGSAYRRLAGIRRQNIGSADM
jgi:glycosyltransferase involved in cell wall biosynthesis